VTRYRTGFKRKANFAPQKSQRSVRRTGWAREDAKAITAFIKRFGQRVTDAACVALFIGAEV
jgi:hypothetical protein